jgi:hypothetical protein
MRPFLFALFVCGLMACTTPAPSPPSEPRPATAGSTPDQPAEPGAGAPQAIAFSAFPCFGFCPDFTVTVSADGSVLYEGRRFVRLEGVHALPDNPALFQALTEVIASPRLPWPRGNVEPGKGDCDPVATDLPSYRLSVRTEGAPTRGFSFYSGCGGAQAARARALTDTIMQTLAAHGVPTEGVPPARGEP